MQPYFRDAVGDDLTAIVEIVRAAEPWLGPELSTSRLTRSIEDIDRHPGCYLLVGEYGGRLGAVLEMTVFPTLTGGGPTAEIVGLWTADSFRTSGIDAMLLDHAIDRADDLGCTRLQVMTPGTRSRERGFWERSGFIHLDAGYVRTPHQALRRIS